MESLLIEKTYSTPGISFNGTTGDLEIVGRSIPERPHLFFGKILEWLDSYLASDPPKIVIHIRVDYFNSGSRRFLWDFLGRFETFTGNGTQKDVELNWYFETDDEEMKDMGDDFKDSIKLKINVIEVSRLY